MGPGHRYFQRAMRSIPTPMHRPAPRPTRPEGARRLLSGVFAFGVGLASALGEAGLEPAAPAAGGTKELGTATPQVAPARLRRTESFLGIHFDFHAGPNATEVGRHTTPEMIETIIRHARPDYIQIDGKGHKGLSSYPTLVGNRAPGFVGDPLRTWREVTARHGVALYLHYSGVWDNEALRLHPDWAVTGADGSRDPNAVSPFSPYDRKLLVPQLRELAGSYGLDGAWVDGECWVAQPDYGEAAAKAFGAATGATTLPRTPGQPHWEEFLEFNRQAFRDHVAYYLRELKASHPEFQLTSNWAYSDYMAEPVRLPLDFLSGDLSPEDSVNSARLSARYLAQQGKPWDLMAWSFVRVPDKDGRALKSAVQLQREAALVVALGGGFQTYFRQRRDGSIFTEQMPLAGEVARFARARQAFSHGGRPVPQIALLLSTPGHYRRTQALFQRSLSPLSGLLEALTESRCAVDVVSEHHLQGRLADWPLVVVPDWEVVEPRFRDELQAHVRDGGRLLLVGRGPLALYRAELGERPEGERKASLHVLGKGLVAVLPFDAGTEYQERHEETLRAQLASLVTRLFPEPLAELEGSPALELIPMRSRDGLLTVHLVNVSGPHRSQTLIDTIEPVGPCVLRLRLERRPAALRLLPGEQALDFEYADGIARVRVPAIAVHAAVQVVGK